MSNALRELFDLLTARELPPNELDQAMVFLESSDNQESYEWIDDPSDALLLPLCDELGDFLVIGDHLLELHEQVQDMFEPPLPDFPNDLNDNSTQNTAHYYAWLDGILAQRGEQPSGYAVVSLSQGVDDNIRWAVVWRNDLPRILTLAAELDLQLSHENGTSVIE